MAEIFQQLMAWISLHPMWSGVVIFLVAMAESLAVVGLLVPGVVIMFGIGALISVGAIPFWSALGWAVAGAVAGDSLSFWLGHHYRQQLTNIWPFSRHPKSLEQGIAFFNRYGGKSVAIGRFFGPVRAIIPLVAGMMGMSPSRFVAANVISALVWAPAYLLPGIVFGASLELASEVALRLVVLILLLALIVWLGLLLSKWTFRLLQPHTSAWVAATLRWSRLHPKSGEIAAALADPDHPEARGLSIFAFLLLATTAIFTLLLTTVVEGSHIESINQGVLQALQSIRTPWSDHLMIYLTRLADDGVVFSLIIGVLIFLIWRGHRRTTLYWLAAALFCLIAGPLLKMGLQIPRPDVVTLAPDSYAFPSGHTLRAAVLYGFLSVIVARPLSLRWRWLPYGLAALVTVAVGLSRLYLGVHWLSDVLGSIALGVAWVAVLAMAYHRHTHIESHWGSLMTTAITVTLLAFSLKSGLHHERDFSRYQPLQESREISAKQWWQGDTIILPGERSDIRSHHDDPLNLQYAGELNWLNSRLAESGWRPAKVLSWSNSLHLLSPTLPLHQLPVLPQVHDGRHEALLLEKKLPDDQRLVLRLWQTGVRLVPGGATVWIGNVSEQQQVRIVNLVTLAATGRDFSTPFQILSDDLATLPAGTTRQVDGRVLVRPQPN
ncbi:MAG: VTT domain-containing protein [Sedimenticola sp.]